MVPDVRLADSSRLISIDFLRGCAALGVVITHSFPHEQLYLAKQSPWFGYLGAILKIGGLGVPLFFVISGFCIHLGWANRYSKTGNRETNWFDFWKRRVYRLYPPYLVVMCFGMLVVVTAYLLGRAEYYPEPRLRWIGLDFITHLFMLHGVHPVFDTGAFNPPMWTLAREEYFYILYLGLLAWRRAWGITTAVISVLTLGLFYPYLSNYFLPVNSSYGFTIYPSVFVLWIQWVLGMVAVEAYYGIIKLPRLSRRLIMVLLGFVLGELSLYHLPLLTPLMWGLTFFILINVCVEAEKKYRWSERRVIVWLSNVGLFSYSLYLVHYPVIMIMRELSSVMAQPSNAWVALSLVPVKIVVCYYVAKLFFRFVESRFLNSPVKFRKVEIDKRDASECPVSA
jgi:peptidoglycan/LPS O-acetylase OafA/YrhL